MCFLEWIRKSEVGKRAKKETIFGYFWGTSSIRKFFEFTGLTRRHAYLRAVEGEGVLVSAYFPG